MAAAAVVGVTATWGSTFSDPNENVKFALIGGNFVVVVVVDIFGLALISSTVSPSTFWKSTSLFLGTPSAVVSFVFCVALSSVSKFAGTGGESSAVFVVGVDAKLQTNLVLKSWRCGGGRGVLRTRVKANGFTTAFAKCAAGASAERG